MFVNRVIVVDDGSGDGTAEEARRAGAEVVAFAENRGKGHALEAGFARALELGAAAVAALDGDGQHDPAEIPRFLRALDRADAVVGTRMSRHDGMPPLRLFANRAGSALVTRFTHRRVTDAFNGFRAFRAEALRAVPIRPGNYDVEPDHLIRIARAGFRVAEVPVTTLYLGGKSEIRPGVDTLRFFRMLARAVASEQ